MRLARTVRLSQNALLRSPAGSELLVRNPRSFRSETGTGSAQGGQGEARRRGRALRTVSGSFDKRGDLVRPGSRHAPAGILEVYIQALTGFRRVLHPYDHKNTLCPKLMQNTECKL